MTTGSAIHSLAEYCLRKGLIAPSEKTWAINTILTYCGWTPASRARRRRAR